ncbi:MULTISPECIES: hypothetical protein [unclassified Virgibacillus]|uniref:hypothetical protein n=1 Tax=unclassified Virgibacillus TaxID=2620237 RepID=UPI0024DEAD78|nr:hypothetical protein [Virgibacillus sp. LDC-1]
MIGLFHRSVQNKEKLMIFYIDSTNHITQRIIRVLDVNEKQVLAFCYWRKQVRTFKLDKILSADVLRKRKA